MPQFTPSGRVSLICLAGLSLLLTLAARPVVAQIIVQGTEFRVNTTTTGAQSFVVAAMAPDGRFVLVWSGVGPGDDSGIFM